MSRPYFGDGPALIQAAEHRTYVIQAPGYWLYARLAGFFQNPAIGLSFVNALLSALGAVVFYRVCLRLTTRWAARLATAAYASIYFAWFAGCVQSSYAGELFFAPLLLLFLIRCIENRSAFNLCGVAASYALAAGIRPADGIFLTPVIVYFARRYLPGWKNRVLFGSLVLGLCLIWFVPQQIALNRLGSTAGSQLWSVAKNEAPILHGISKRGVSNVVRTVVPLALAFWPLLPAILVSHGRYRRLLWIWLLPGLAFFALVYISDAPYLCFCVAAFLALALSPIASKHLYAGLGLCCAWNILFFSFARPVEHTANLGLAVYSVSGARYCAWALRHQWYRTLRTYTGVSTIGSERPAR